MPKGYNVSRFLTVLGTEPHRTLLGEVFNAMIRLLGAVVESLGEHTAGDSSALSGRSDGKASLVGLDEPTGGKKEYTDAEGKVTRVIEWFGYKFHLLVDVRHEVALAYRISTANVGDCEYVEPLVRQGQANLPEGRIKTLAYDMAADTEGVHRTLKQAGIAPVIENRSLWKADFERMLPGHDGRSNVVHDEAGTIYCYDKQSDPPRRHRMAYLGHEPSRGTLKYRCPAIHEGWTCPSESICNAGRAYGKTLRVKREIDLRRFPPIPRATRQFERLYKGRTAVERVNGRTKDLLGRRRWQHHRGGPVPRVPRRGDGGACRTGDAAGGNAATGGNARPDAAGPDRQGVDRETANLIDPPDRLARPGRAVAVRPQ